MLYNISTTIIGRAQMKPGNYSRNSSLSHVLDKELLVLQESNGAFKRVAKSCSYNDKLLRQDPTQVGDSVMMENSVTDAREKLYCERKFYAKPPNSGYKYHRWETNGKWFITSYKATRFYNGKPVFSIKDKHLRNGWKTTLKIWPVAKEIHTPPESSEIGRRKHLLAEFLKEIRDGNKTTEADLKQYSIEREREHDSGMSISYILAKRYGNRKNLNIIELGPYCCTVVPRAILKEGTGNRYTALDLSLLGLQKQHEFLKEEGGYMVSRSRQVVGDFYNAPFLSESADLIVAIACFPFSLTRSKEKDFIDATSEVARLLKGGGEFVLPGAGLEQSSPAAVAHLLKLFDVVDSNGEGIGRTLVFRKKNNLKQKPG